jgi:ribonuclease P protein component
MLKKISRLTKDKEFENVLKKGKGIYNPMFSLKALANDLPHNRYGIIVSLKVHKKATERNKIKRRVREALRSFDKLIRIHQDMVIVCRASMVNVEFQEIKKALNLILFKLKLFNDNKPL